jgi:hypothetical protein
VISDLVFQALVSLSITRAAVYECKLVQTVLPLLAQFHGVFLLRRRTDDPPVDSAHPNSDFIIGILRYYSHLSECVKKGFQLVNAADCEIQKDFSVYSYCPDAANFDAVVRILGDVKNYCVEWDKSHVVEDVSALSGAFSLNPSLCGFFFELLSIAMQFLNIPLAVIAERLQLFESWPIIARSVTAIAGLDYFAPSAFCFGRYLRKPRSRFAFLAGWSHQCSVILAVSRDCAPFVLHAIRAFGADKWLNSDGEFVEPLVEPWMPACLLCRFFVALLSNFTPPDGWNLSDLVPSIILHLLAIDPATASMAIKPFSSDENRQIALVCLINGTQAYKTKSSHTNSVTPFWIYIDLPEFLSLPRIDEVNGRMTAGFTTTPPFIDSIAKPEQSNIATYFALLGLIQMTAEVSRFPRPGLPSRLLSPQTSLRSSPELRRCTCHSFR